LDDTPSTQKVSDRGVLPEVEAYAYLLVVIYLIDAKQLPQVHPPSSYHTLKVRMHGEHPICSHSQLVCFGPKFAGMWLLKPPFPRFMKMSPPPPPPALRCP